MDFLSGHSTFWRQLENLIIMTIYNRTYWNAKSQATIDFVLLVVAGEHLLPPRNIEPNPSTAFTRVRIMLKFGFEKIVISLLAAGGDRKHVWSLFEQLKLTLYAGLTVCKSICFGLNVSASLWLSFLLLLRLRNWNPP